MKAENNLLNIIYLDTDIAVIVKPPELLSIPGRGEDKFDSVSSRLKQLYPRTIDQPSVHRLDMQTSGLMVLAFNRESHRNLSIQFQNREIIKHYIAILNGELKTDSGRIELAFRLDPNNRPYQVYDPINGKIGITEYKKIETKNGKSKVLFKPSTGRTHQLRLHSAHTKGLGIPIIGDRLYGNSTENDRLLLHANYLEFNHPINNKRISFSSEADF